MQSRRELILKSLAILLAAIGLGAGDSGKSGPPLEVTYYYLPG